MTPRKPAPGSDSTSWLAAQPGAHKFRRIDVPVEGRSYAILLGEGLIERAGELIAQKLKGERALIVWDEAVATPHGKLLYKSLSAQGVECLIAPIPSGESSKNLRELTKIWMSLATAHVGRDGALIAIGGGMVGDLAGFAAATWLRGVDFFLVPTTLLSMVDAAIGGKTAVNISQGKNLIGSFWQPRLVIADVGTLSTLPLDEYRSGLAEVVKYGVIRDKDLFEALENKADAIRARDMETLTPIIEWCCSIKAEIVGRDEREAGDRELLNFGHTIGHAIETLTGYSRFRHGEAVAIGMIAEGRIARMLGTGWTDAGQERLEELLGAFELPRDLRYEGAPSASDIVTSTYSDKKARGGRVRYALPTGIGAARQGFEVEDAVAFEVLGDLGAG